MSEGPAEYVEFQVQVLIEADPSAGRRNPHLGPGDLNFVEGELAEALGRAKGIRFVITVADQDDNVLTRKFSRNQPSEELKRKAWQE